MVCLSKEKTQFPLIGKARPIAILPHVFKAFEQVILSRLQEALQNCLVPLHKNQRGFVADGSTHRNIISVTSFLGKAIDAAKLDRSRRTPIRLRKATLAILLDFSSAFDRVDRRLLIQKLSDKGIQSDLINVICKALSYTSHTYAQENHTYYTNIGVL